MGLEIIYEDDDIIVINKPSGIAVHPDKTHQENTLIQQLVKLRLEIARVGPPAGGRPGLVHRLDKDTSGLLLVAKNNAAFSFYKNAFKEGKINKTYLALVEGVIKKDSDVIDLPIGRSRRDPRVRVASKKAFGKLREAKTEFRVLKRLHNPDAPVGAPTSTMIDFDTKVRRGYTLLEVQPLTGRTHQIRAHLKAYGHPIVCDTLYNKKATRLAGGQACPAGLKRHFLHAVKLEFTTRNGKNLNLEARLPKDLTKTLEGV